MTFISEDSKGTVKTLNFQSITPLLHITDLVCAFTIPNGFANTDQVSSNNMQWNQPLPPRDDVVVGSHYYLQKQLHILDLLEPTPIGQGYPQAVPSLDIKLLQDVLNIPPPATTPSLHQENIDHISARCAKRKLPSSSCPSPALRNSYSLAKKRRTGDDTPAFRPYQETKWSQQYLELVKFKEEYGHCNVPHSYKPALGLAKWIKRQRYQYKLRSQDKVSTITDARIQALESIGFVWDSHDATWDQRFEELKEFRSRYGHCDVPSNFPSNPQLATWVKCQRRQYRLFFKKNALSSRTPKRIT